jgi:ribosome biogenesis GTPase A
MIDEILQGKPRLVLLNKADLADPGVTAAWVAYFKEANLDALPIDAISGNQVKEIVPRCKVLVKHQIDTQIRKGINPRAVRALIVGIPNVGKSTLINRMAGKKIAATGDRPGVTKGQQWIKMGTTEMELLDTPGILWPKFEDQNVGMRLAATGAIKEELLQADEIAFFTIRYLAEHYKSFLMERYSMETIPADLSDPNEIVKIMENIGRKRGIMQSGGRVDLDKTSMVILRELRAGKMGRVSLEAPS